MKSNLFILLTMAIIALITFSSCNGIEPERQYPNPGYIQSDEILPNTGNPLTQISLTSDMDTVTIGTPFRVRAKATYKSGEIVVVDYKVKYSADHPLTQINVNEFVGDQEGSGWIHGEFSSNGGTCSDSVLVVIISR